ncbi:hypothetical protein FRC09_019399 [Ceratobasidium sp. 395]|nr:hypothetical protein FRC09_019399 [Ceratobasidium sp. 395]
MARGKATMYARATRRAAMMLPRLPRVKRDDPQYAEKRRTCPHCHKRLDTVLGRDLHITLNRRCRAQQERYDKKQRERERKERERKEREREEREREEQEQKRKRENQETLPESEPTEREPPPKRPRLDEDAPPVAGPSRLPIPNPPIPGPDPSNLMDAGDGTFVEAFPNAAAGASLGTRRIDEQELKAYLEACGRLGDCDLFETAEILMTTGLNSAGRTKHLRGPAYKQWLKGKGKEVWKDDDEMTRDIDRLPQGAKWTTARVSAGKGSFKRNHTVHFRDILAVIRQLIGARRFRRFMRYAPEKHWATRERKTRIYDEMWSGEWWWRMQYLIGNKSGTVVPLIIASDETTLTNNPQGPKGHPVYLSLGNISKAVRRRPTKRAMVVIGYLPVDSYDDVLDDETRREYRNELLHRSLEKIFEPLRTASEDGMLAWCADGSLRHIYPVIASWIADWPEQNNLAGTTQGGCPKCMHGWTGRSSGRSKARPRDPDATLKATRAYEQSKKPARLKPLRLRGVVPFWDGISHVDIGVCLTPDLLHQLYKGLFEHARNWVEDLLGTTEFNRRFKTMPSAKDLRHFQKGVTTVKNWAGRESRDMMRQFLPVVIDAQAPADFVRMIRALLDFSYLAHCARLSDVDLAELEAALAAFHDAKDVLVKIGIVKKQDSFDRIAKLHMLSHYADDIRDFGAPDGYSTETPEYLHIVYVKVPWRMSNRRNPFPQVVKYVRRLEAIHIQRTAIDEFYGEREGADEEEIELAQKLIEDEGEASGNGDGQEGGEYKVDDGSDGCSKNKGDADGDEDGEQAAIEPESEVSALPRNPAYYPRPSLNIARLPTTRHVPGHVLASSYGATDCIRAVSSFIRLKTGEEPPLLLPTDRFDVWHKATLYHSLLPFAPSESPHRDVVRVHPILHDKAGRVIDSGVFDTALFATDRDAFGIDRFRAGRVRAIFTLPPRLYHLYSKPLVYLELYSRFVPDATHTHELHRLTPAHSSVGDTVASLVIPLACVTMACHLAPDFSSHRTLNRYFFNNFYNHFTFLLLAHWRRLKTTH